tara:strand:+ start:174 stop:554 length:381 start_codon:yes stop_codon:yes gene_type:complete
MRRSARLWNGIKDYGIASLEGKTIGELLNNRPSDLLHRANRVGDVTEEELLKVVLETEQPDGVDLGEYAHTFAGPHKEGEVPGSGRLDADVAVISELLLWALRVNNQDRGRRDLVGLKALIEAKNG